MFQICQKKAVGKKKNDSKGWTSKLSKELHAAIDGKLAEDKLKSVRSLLIDLEYNRRRKLHNQILQVSIIFVLSYLEITLEWCASWAHRLIFVSAFNLFH